MPRGVAKHADTVNWNAFVHESDPEVNSGYTEATKNPDWACEDQFPEVCYLSMLRPFAHP